MKDKYLHIFSFDGLSKVDIKKMKELPAFKEFYKNASGSNSVISTYPSVTYCAHTSIVTGVFPNKHGVINNTKVQPMLKNPDWYWQYDSIKVPTFQSIAKNAGYDVLSIFWPVSASSKDIKYNMPEIVANRKFEMQFLKSLFNGSKYYQFMMFMKFSHLLDGVNEPELDNFSHASLLYSLEHFETDITMTHFVDLDTQRHAYGFNSKQADEALVRLDKKLGEFIDKLKELGRYENSVIVVLGDHSSFDCDYTIHVNKLFAEKGLLTSTKNGLISSYKAICKTSDGCSYIYADSDITDRQLLSILNPLLEEGIIHQILTNEEASELGADEKCRFMLEASRGYFFEDDVTSNYIMPIKKLKVNRPKTVNVNNHGYNPYIEDYETVFLVAGKGIKKNVFFERTSIVNEAPTLAAILELEMPNDIDGKKLDILED